MIAPPPALKDLRRGTQLIAGMSVTTIHADFDFETYSPAGFVWNDSLNKFQPPRGANKKGLPVVGAAVYSEHPDAEVLSCAYNLKDGAGNRLWKPGDAPPSDLWAHVESCRILEAWNCGFEFWIWTNICMPKYGWPPLKRSQLRCAAAKARAFALPGSLDPAGAVLDIQNKKLKDGKRLLTKFSWPRNPTKKDLRTRILPSEDPEDAQKLYEYNMRDIEAEAELSSLIPDLSTDELTFWQIDQEINGRGVAMDRPMINACMSIIDQAHEKYNQEVFALTHGEVTAASQLQKMKKWLNSHGVYAKSLAAEALAELLNTSIDGPVRRVLEIRSLIGSAAVAKLFTMNNQLARDDRMKDLFAYHSARTGRAAGRGVQPQNLPNSGPEVFLCDQCKKYYKALNGCSWCGHTQDNKTTHEWNPGAVHDALEIIATRSLDCVEYYFTDAIGTISGCIRGLFVSAPDHDLVCSDFSSIEAVVIAAIAEEEWRMEVFETHGKIYEASASKISGLPLSTILAEKQTTGKHHPLRKLGKVAELACFTSDTQVLTRRGYIRIVDVLKTDKLWDGVEWVSHAGLIFKGKREVISLDGVKMTPTHPINIGNSWREAQELLLNESILTQALANGSVNLPILETTELDLRKEIGLQAANALVEHEQLPPTVICVPENQHGALFAQKKLVKQLIQNGLNITGVTKTLSQMLFTGGAWAVESLRQLVDAIRPRTLVMRTTAQEESSCAMNGAGKEESFLGISQRFRAGITNYLRWTESTRTKDMSREIFNSLPGEETNSINEKSLNFKNESPNLSNVYDIVNAGSRHRFTIKTNSGHLIVHNSAYGSWIGGWKAFKANEFLSDEEIKSAILKWRDASPEIVKLWYGLEGIAHKAVLSPGTKFSYKSLSFLCKGNVLYGELPSGRFLTYHRPRLSESTRKHGTLSLTFEGWNTNPKYGAIGWQRMDTYGGKICENVVQGIARDILAFAIVNLEAAGYPVVLHVHDEIVCEVPENFGSVEEFERIMGTMPAWAADWPIRAQGGWRAKRYTK